MLANCQLTTDNFLIRSQRLCDSAVKKLLRITKIVMHYSVVILALVLLACQREKPANKKMLAEKPVVTAPEFNADSAYGFVKTQCDFGPRKPGTKQHAACA